jgi:hypothetical protein
MNRDDPWDCSRQELAAYTALESGGNVDLRIVEKNLRNSDMSKRNAQGVLQAVVDNPKEKK